MKISDEQIEEFNSTGFLIIRDLYNADRMQEIIKWTEEVTNYPEVPGKYMMYFEESKLSSVDRILSRMEDIEPFHQGFSNIFMRGEIQQITSQFFNDEAIRQHYSDLQFYIRTLALKDRIKLHLRQVDVYMAKLNQLDSLVRSHAALEGALETTTRQE